MNKALVAIVAVVIVALFAFVFWPKDTGITEETVTPSPDIQDTLPEETPTFSWRFEEAETMNLDGNPQTHVFVTATRGAEEQEWLVDTVDGGCSEIEGESAEDDISNTGRVQCYAAGLGQEYRITQDGDAYVIERKLYEEALPNIAPPEYEWEVIAEFSAM